MCNVDPGRRWERERIKEENWLAHKMVDLLRHSGSIRSSRGETIKTVGNQTRDAAAWLTIHGMQQYVQAVTGDDLSEERIVRIAYQDGKGRFWDPRTLQCVCLLFT